MSYRRILKYAIAVSIVGLSLAHTGRQASKEWINQKPMPSMDEHEIINSKSKASATSKNRSKRHKPSEPIKESSQSNMLSRAKDIQQALVKCGFLPQEQVDGIMGQTTANAIKAFQNSVGVTPDGIFGSTTASKAAFCE